MTVFRQHGDALDTALSLLWLGYAASAAGEEERARKYFEESLSLYSDLGYTQRIARVLLSLAELDEGKGNRALACARAQQSLELFRKAGYGSGVAHAQSFLGKVLVRSGDLVAAAPLLTAAVHRLHDTGSWVDLADVLDICIDLAAQYHRPELIVRLAMASDRMHRADWYAAHQCDAERLSWHRNRARRALGHAAVQRIEAEASVGDRDTVVVQVLDLLQHVAHDAASPDSRFPSKHVTLSPRERDVLRLLSAGMTDREIAEALYITRKTASDHVGHILAKLGVANRAEAAAVAVRDRLV